jgi:NTP pyrophosphatase (non-canonical NTP hydrolase)
MDFIEYQEVTQKTFKEHVGLDAYQSRLLNWALGLSGETGEVHELLKHHIYGHAPLNKMEVAKELGDVLWYLSAIATTLDLRLEDIALLNDAKLEHRYASGGYTTKGSADRHESEKAFKDTMLFKCIEARINHTLAPMNVIFLGPDGSGKTTIAKKVAAEMGWSYQKCDYRQDDKINLARTLLQDQTNIIYDRFYFPDDLVYLSVKGEEITSETRAGFLEIERLLTQLNTLIIYVTADEATLAERSKVWADDYVKVEQLKAVKQQYGYWLRRWENKRISTFKLNTSGIEVDSPEYQGIIFACVDAIKSGQQIYSDIIG